MEVSSKKQSSCAACYLLRRICPEDCVFVPYFPADETLKFINVHKVFGSSNVRKMLTELPEHQRGEAISSMVYEANIRVKDPVYGCKGVISSLQQQVDLLQTQLALAQVPENASPISSSRNKQSDSLKSLLNMDMEDQAKACMDDPRTRNMYYLVLVVLLLLINFSFLLFWGLHFA